MITLSDGRSGDGLRQHFSGQAILKGRVVVGSRKTVISHLPRGNEKRKQRVSERASERTVRESSYPVRLELEFNQLYRSAGGQIKLAKGYAFSDIHVLPFAAVKYGNCSASITPNPGGRGSSSGTR